VNQAYFVLIYWALASDSQYKGSTAFLPHE